MPRNINNVAAEASKRPPQVFFCSISLGPTQGTPIGILAGGTRLSEEHLSSHHDWICLHGKVAEAVRFQIRELCLQQAEKRFPG